MKRILSLILSLVFVLGLSVHAFAVEEPLVERSFALDLNASLGFYNENEYIVLEIGVVDITDPYGVASVEFDIQFDGEKLVPLWQTSEELNGDGVTTSVPPQMVAAWPTVEITKYIPGYGLYTEEMMAVEGLCKNYSKTGSGKLNINLVMDTDYCNVAVKEDNEILVRLYFTPVDGFENGATYSFVVDGDYDFSEERKAFISLAGTSGLVFGDYEDRRDELRIFGYGDETSVTVRGTAYEESSSEPDSESTLPRPSVSGVGDVNFDGYADNLDAALVLRYDASLIVFEPEQLEAGDVDGDGVVNSLDSAKLLKYDVGLIDSFR